MAARIRRKRGGDPQRQLNRGSRRAAGERGVLTARDIQRAGGSKTFQGSLKRLRLKSERGTLTDRDIQRIERLKRKKPRG